MTTFTKSTNSVHKIKLESQLIYALWSYKQAFAGQETELEVRTSLVGNGAKIKITCKTEKGKKLDKIEGSVVNNRFKGKILIPEKCKPDEMIYFEAELPKHGLRDESNSIPVRPPLKVSKIQWDRQEVKRDEEVTLTCTFENGVEEKDEATVLIYEHNPNSCDIKVVSIPTVIKNSKVEMQWKFNYQDDTALIPTNEEMKPYQKNYANPQFYFVVVVDGVRIGEKRESGLMKFKDSLEIQAMDRRGNPLINCDCTVTFADGTKLTGRTDSQGTAIIKDVPPGDYEITYTPQNETVSP